MKLPLLILIFGFLSILPVKAIEEITLLSGQKYLGFVVDESKENLSIIDQFNSEIKINKQSITIRQRMFAEVVTRFGAKYTATLRTIEEDNIIFFDDKGSEIRIPKSDLDYIIVNNTKLTPDNWRVLSGANLSTLNGHKTRYSAFGFTVGLPGIFNANYIMNYSNGLGFKLSGGYWGGEYFGFQANLLYNLEKTHSFDANLFVGAGYSRVGKTSEYDSFYNRIDYVRQDYEYIGGGFDINLHGFYLELGISAGEGHFETPQIIGAFGFIYRFND